MRASSYIVLMAIGAGSFGTAADTPATSPTATPSPRRKTPRSFFLAGKESRGLIVCPERDKMGVEIPCPPNVFCLPPYATCEGAKYVLRDWIPPRERAQCNACKCSGPRIPVCLTSRETRKPHHTAAQRGEAVTDVEVCSGRKRWNPSPRGRSGRQIRSGRRRLRQIARDLGREG